MKNILLKRIFPMLLALVLMMGMFTVGVSAADGETIMSFSPKNPKVGDTFTVTLKYDNFDLSATTVSGELVFDTTILKYASCNANGGAQCANGVVKFGATVNPDALGEAYIRVDFEVIAEGVSRVSLRNAIAAQDETKFYLENSSAQLITANADNNQNQANGGEKAALSTMTVVAGQLEPAFDPNITEYRVTVPYTQNDGVITGDPKEAGATLSVTGNRELAVGITTRTVTVVGPDGSRRDYVVHFNRLDENGNDTTIPVGGGITFNYNGKDYRIGSVGIGTIPPVGFYLSTVTINDTEVSAYKDSSGKAVLLYLVATDSSDEGLFIYEDGNIYAFHYISAGGGVYIIKDIASGAALPAGMVRSTYVIDGKEVSCFKYADAALADFVVFSAISPKGNSGYYSYDVNENTMQRIVKFASAAAAQTESKEIEISKSTKTVIMMLVIIFAILLILLIVALVVKTGKRYGKNLGKIFEVEEEYIMEDSSTSPDDKF